MIARTDTNTTLLDQLLALGLKVDLDSCDVAFARTLPFRPADMTSNQAIIAEAILDPTNKETVEAIVRSLPGMEPFDVFTILHAKFAKEILPHITGRVLAQTTPSKPHDREAIIAHARAYAKAYNAEGISNDRFCIKIPTTTSGVQAAVVLQSEGIQTLGTALFNVAQAHAAAQAGMYAISPYFNEVKAHDAAERWPDVADPGLEHPMAHRMGAIRDAYDALRAQDKYTPQIKGASYISVLEVLAQPELGCEHVTLHPGPIEDLLWATGQPALAGGKWKQRLAEYTPECTPWTAPSGPDMVKRDTQRAAHDPLGNAPTSPGVHYLADGVLDAANDADPATKQRFEDAMACFVRAEDNVLEFIADIQRS